MDLARRGRSIAVSGFLLGGAVSIIASTQTWLTVQRADAGADILVPGASALPLLAPLSLAVLALGAALSLTGSVLRLIFGALAGAVAILMGWSTLQLLLSSPVSAVASTVTDVTGIAGAAGLADLIGAIVPTAWPVIALVGWAILLIAAVVVVLTGRTWKSGGRRYRTDAGAAAVAEGPVDAVDSWDDLSRGTDPTR